MVTARVRRVKSQKGGGGLDKRGRRIRFPEKRGL